MDNAFKALIMGASVLLFVIGISTAVISYTRTMDAVDNILTSSEQYSRTAESFTYDNNANQRDTTRVIKASEIVFQVLDMWNSQDMKYKKITVESLVFTSETRDESKLKQILANDEYEISSQDYDNKTIVYRVH